MRRITSVLLIIAMCVACVAQDTVPQPKTEAPPVPRYRKVCQGGTCRMVPVQAPAQSEPEQNAAFLPPAAPTPAASAPVPSPADPATRPIETRISYAYPVQLRSVLVKRPKLFPIFRR